MNSIRQAWEKRASDKGSDLASVLLKGLPPDLNHYIHDFHIRLIQNHFLPYLPQQAVLLDLACGYGRISQPILKIRPDIQIIGSDFSIRYCQSYIQNTGLPVVCADIEKLPFQKKQLDGLLAITALMYVNHQKEVIEQIISILKPNGIALFIDPGDEFAQLVNWFKKRAGQTSGHPFKKKDYYSLFKNKKIKILDHGGIPAFSFLLPILMLTQRFRYLNKNLLKLSDFLDRKISRWDRFSLHRWILVQKVESNTF